MALKCNTKDERKAIFAKLAAANKQAIPANQATIENEIYEPDKVVTKAVPVQGFYTNTSRSIPDLFDYIANTRLDIGKDYPAFLDNFDDFRIEVFDRPENGLLENVFNRVLKNYDPLKYTNRRQYVLVGTRNKGKGGEEYDENIGSLPVDRVGYGQSKALYDYIHTNFAGNRSKFQVPVNKAALKTMLEATYGAAWQKASKPQITIQKDHKFSLKDLKKRYGANYPNLFSKVYCITDTRSGRFARNAMGKDMGNKMVGKSVIFYNKFPNREQTVDEILQRGSINDDLGYIVLDEDVAYRSVEELRNLVRATGNDDPGYSGQLLLSDNILFKLFNALYADKSLSTSVFNDTFSAMLNQVVNEHQNGDGTSTLEVKATRVNRHALLQQLDAIIEDETLRGKFDGIINDPKVFPNGVYISPVLVGSNLFKRDSIAQVHQTPANEDYLYSRLMITDLADNVISIPNFEIAFSEDKVKQAEQFQELFSEPASESAPEPTGRHLSADLITEPDGSVNISGTLDTRTLIGKEPTATVSEILEPFAQKYGISAKDLEDFVASEFNDIIMNNPSESLSEVMRDYLEKNGTC